MASDRCPECRSDGVRRSSTLALHFVRLLLRDPHRYCPRCNARWLSHADRREGPRGAAAVAILLAASSLMLLGQRSGRFRPIPPPSGAASDAQLDRLLKEDKHKLWNEYGQYFSSKDQARQFYGQVKSDRDKAKARQAAGRP